MRLHRLRVQAFGPFAGVEEVDVDALCEQGLFLLHGPTGAGKTSVLDALCFALYGRVPGARSGGRLRSDHAQADLAPEVRCELTAADRRFEVTRSPAWARPKKRGEGTTTEQARTLVREKVDGEWVARSSRNDEASQLLTDVLGMGMEQFTRVVLLPQGEFAAFLRAPADERRALLQRLFGTDRFADVESWLVEARRTTGRALERAEVGLDRLLARVEEAAAVLPGRDAHLPPSDPVASVQALAGMARQALASGQAEHDATAGEVEQAREQHSQAHRARERATTLSRILAEKAHLEAESATVAQASATLARAGSAAAVSGHLSAVAGALVRVQGGATAVAAAERQALGLGTELPVGTELAQCVRGAREQVGRLEDLLDVEQDALRATVHAQALAGAVSALAAQRRRHDEAADVLLRRRSTASEKAQQLTRPAGTVEALEAELAHARQVHAAAVEAARLTVAVDGLHGRALRAAGAAQDARQRWLDVREERLAGIAAELAASLEAGSPCPVCGGVDHPRVATPVPTAVSAADETAARVAFDDAQEAAGRAGAALASAREDCAGAASRSGGATSEEGAAAVTALARRLDDARNAHDALVELTSSLAALDVEVAAARAASGRAGERLAAAQVEAEAATRAAQSLDERLSEGRGDDPSVAARRERLIAQASVLEAVAACRVELEAARAAHAAVLDEATVAVTAAGFVDVTEAAGAALDDEAREQLRSVLVQHGDALAAARSRLAEPDLVLAAQEARAQEETRAREGSGGAQGAAPVEDLRERLAAAEAAERRTIEHMTLVRRAVTTLEDLLQHVAADVAASTPLRARHELVSDLARCAEGTGGGNALRMRLSAFVLAARLEQVAAAATARLDAMSSGRYALVHSDALERGGARSGLGLQVVDAWTGAHRDTASLSGGEAFMASLSLALGLADVVQAEAGGSIIETLFVDEGFGSLDEETLDEVMATLDALREGGRAVGLVSHVAELRNRIPARLEVLKTRTGSHLRSRPGAA